MNGDIGPELRMIMFVTILMFSVEMEEYDMGFTNRRFVRRREGGAVVVE